MPFTKHAARYLVPPARERNGIALCLAGGGFRAALFHLGAVRRLNELGLLQQLRTISAVSGGTLIAAHLAEQWHRWSAQPLTPGEWDRVIAAPFRAFTSRNLSAWPVLKGLLRPWSNAGVLALANRLERRGLSTLTLGDLPDRPAFKFCASDLVSGLSYVYERDPFTGPHPSAGTRVAEASAVSACHPLFFRPFSADRPQRIALVDGGIYDDRGIEPVWQTHRTLLVSDSGDVLRPQRADSLVWPLARSAAVIWNRYQEVQRRWLLAYFDGDPMAGTYWSIAGATEHYDDRGRFAGYSAALARDAIATIRTDYDAFSDAEAAVLENHGYLLANAAAQAHLSSLPHVRAALSVPHPTWMPEPLVRDALRDSSRKRLVGRGFFDFLGRRAEPTVPLAPNAAAERRGDSAGTRPRPTADEAAREIVT